MKIGGNFNGTGSTLYLCIGFVPDWIWIMNLEATTPVELVWNKHMMRSGDMIEGFEFQWNSTFSSSDAEQLTKGAGVLPYYGGTVLTTTTAGTTTYAEGNYLKPFNYDVRFLAADSSHDYNDASEETLDTWTLDSATNYTGHFNGGCTGTYIGEGSPIKIDGKYYAIVAFSSDGSDSNDVTLSHNVPSGDIEFIGGMYSTIPMTSGEVTKDGFVINDTTLNANGNLCVFEAGTYDL